MKLLDFICDECGYEFEELCTRTEEEEIRDGNLTIPCEKCIGIKVRLFSRKNNSQRWRYID